MKRYLATRQMQFIALVITGIGFALRLYTLGSESLWYDELLQANLGQMDIPLMMHRLTSHSGVPLDYLITHYWISLGRSDFWVRVPAVMWGTLTLPVVFQLGRRLLGDYEGLLLMTLLAYAPFHVRYSQELRPYALGLLATTLFVYFVWRLQTTGRAYYLGPILIAALVFSLSHYFANAIFGPLLVFLGLDSIFSTTNRKVSFKALLAVLLAGILVVSVLFLLGRGVNLVRVSSKFGVALAQPERFSADPSEKPDLGTGPIVNRTFIEGYVLGPIGAGSASQSLWVFNGLVVLGFLSLLVQRKFKLSLLLSLWVIVPVVGVVLFLIQRGTFFAPRYIIFILPAYFALLGLGIVALPQLLRKFAPLWVSITLFLIVGGSVFVAMIDDLNRLYQHKNKEDWHLVADFIASNASPNDAVIAVRAEPTMSWYYPDAAAPGNYYDDLAVIQQTVAQADRAWVVLSIFSSGIDATIKAWLSDSEQGAIRFVLDPVITVYYLGHNVDKAQLLEDIRGFVLPVDHAIYASLARENRRHPEIALRYFQLAIEHAPDEATKAEYQQAMKAFE